MQLIVDSGSSHSTWVLLKDGFIKNKQILPGINVTSNPQSLSVLDQLDEAITKATKYVHFYGSGISNPSAQKKAQSALLALMPDATINVTNDIIGACRSHQLQSTSIVSILGTGVNTVLYDGSTVIHAIKSLGYYIAEEGSGFNLGRLIMKAFLRGTFTKNDSALFKDAYLQENKDLIKTIYSHPKPNFYIASFSKFLEISSRELRQEITNKNFKSYFENHIKAIPNFKNYRINLVGSIAHYFEKEIQDIASEYEMKIENTLKDPIDGLIKYHAING